VSIAGHHQPDKEVRRTVAAASGHVMKYRAEELLERFGYGEQGDGAAEDVSKRLSALGLTIEPPLAEVNAGDEVSVSIAEDSALSADAKKQDSRQSEFQRRLSDSRTRAEQAVVQLEAARSEIAASAARAEELETRVAELENLLSTAQEDLEREREQGAGLSERRDADARTPAEPAARASTGRQRSRAAKRRPVPSRAQPRAARKQSPPPPAPAREPSISRERGRLWHRRRRPFIEQPGRCSICVRELQVAEGDLATSGWIINYETGLCPDCQRQGWTLPEGASLPSRRPSQASS
jgi:hypothetical protein